MVLDTFDLFLGSLFMLLKVFLDRFDLSSLNVLTSAGFWVGLGRLLLNLGDLVENDCFTRYFHAG